MHKCCNKIITSIALCLLFSFFSLNVDSKTYNSMGQIGLINTPSAEVYDEQSIFLTFTRNEIYKMGIVTVSPFEWLEASYFYYRPDDLLWGSTPGLFLDKGFNIKLSYKPESLYLPTVAIGLDDFAGTGNFTKEYLVSTYNFDNVKVNLGLGWGKFVGNNNVINDPLSFISTKFNFRPSVSENYEQGGNPSFDKWFRGDATIFGGLEISIPEFKNLSFKLESNPFDYYKFSCCGEGLSAKSFDIRNSNSSYNFGISYKTEKFGNLDLSYIKGDSINLSISFGFSSRSPLRKKKKFEPNIADNNFNQNKKTEFYYDLLDNLNRNKLYLQTASLDDQDLKISIDSEEHINPIQYSSKAAFIANEVAKLNELNIRKIDVSHITRGIQLNRISFRSDDIDNKKLANSLLIKQTEIKQVRPDEYKKAEFQPVPKFPLFMYTIEPDIRVHLGSPEKVVFSGLGVKFESEVQLNRNLTISGSIGQSIVDNFDNKVSCPCSELEYVRTEIVRYLQESDNLYISNLQIDNIWSPYKSIYGRLSFGYLEEMYAGGSSELMYKPFESNFVVSIENNFVKKRDYDGRFDLLEYQTNTNHLNVAFYETNTNILVKWSYGKYLAKDKGYTLDLSRRHPSGWQSGFYFTKTNVSAEQFGEGSFDKGFYFNIPFDVFQKKHSKNKVNFALKTMTRDGGQKLVIQNRLVDSFYGISKAEIYESWNGYLN